MLHKDHFSAFAQLYFQSSLSQTCQPFDIPQNVSENKRVKHKSRGREKAKGGAITSGFCGQGKRLLQKVVRRSVGRLVRIQCPELDGWLLLKMMRGSASSKK